MANMPGIDVSEYDSINAGFLLSGHSVSMSTQRCRCFQRLWRVWKACEVTCQHCLGIHRKLHLRERSFSIDTCQYLCYSTLAWKYVNQGHVKIEVSKNLEELSRIMMNDLEMSRNRCISRCVVRSCFRFCFASVPPHGTSVSHSNCSGGQVRTDRLVGASTSSRLRKNKPT